MQLHKGKAFVFPLPCYQTAGMCWAACQLPDQASNASGGVWVPHAACSSEHPLFLKVISSSKPPVWSNGGNRWGDLKISAVDTSQRWPVATLSYGTVRENLIKGSLCAHPSHASCTRPCMHVLCCPHRYDCRTCMRALVTFQMGKPRQRHTHRAAQTASVQNLKHFWGALLHLWILCLFSCTWGNTAVQPAWHKGPGQGPLTSLQSSFVWRRLLCFQSRFGNASAWCPVLCDSCFAPGNSKKTQSTVRGLTLGVELMEVTHQTQFLPDLGFPQCRVIQY